MKDTVVDGEVRTVGPDDPHRCNMWSRWVSRDRYVCDVCGRDTCPHFTWHECDIDSCPVHHTRFRESMRSLARFMVWVEMDVHARYSYTQDWARDAGVTLSELRQDQFLWLVMTSNHVSVSWNDR